MKTKTKFIALIIMLFMALSFGVYQTIAFLTDSHTITNNYTIDTVSATLSVTGAKEVSSEVVNDDLAYIHYVDDFILNKYELLDTMASELKISIEMDNNFDSRVKIKLPSLDELNGLVYIIIDDSVDTIGESISLIIEDNYIKYTYGENTTYNNLIDISTLSQTSSNSDFRTLVDNYNQQKLIDLYTNENNVYQTGTMNFRILIWGDYYSLSDADKPSYLEKTYNFEVEVKVIQAIDKYGGTLDYEND